MSQIESVLNNQRTFQVSKSNEVHLSKTSLILSTEDQVNKAEVLQALHFVNKNLSFASTRDDNDRFRSLFPDSTIAKSYRMSNAKAQYLVKFGIANYLKKKLIYDVNNTPNSFLFDETTNSQVKKQCDAYVVKSPQQSNQLMLVFCLQVIVKLII